MTTFTASTGHTLHICIDKDFLPAALQETRDRYVVTKAVRNWDAKGHIFMYLAKGHDDAPKQVHIFYPNGKMWSGFGKTEKEAIEGAIKDGWKYTN